MATKSPAAVQTKASDIPIATTPGPAPAAPARSRNACMTPITVPKSPMKGATMLTTLQKLGIAPSFSRPGVSDDNAQAEAFFRTLKYRPGYPGKGFKTLQSVRAWVLQFVRWYNTEHRHSALKFVTPAQRHEGADIAVLVARKALYEEAKAANPGRWPGATRNWDRPATVWLNPVRQKDRNLKKAA